MAGVYETTRVDVRRVLVERLHLKEHDLKIVVNQRKAEKQLAQHGWTVFLVKVVNAAGVTAPITHSPSTSRKT